MRLCILRFCDEIITFKCQWLGAEMKAEVTDTQKLRTMDQKQDRRTPSINGLKSFQSVFTFSLMKKVVGPVLHPLCRAASLTVSSDLI